MQKILNKNSPKPQKITVFYDRKLEKITGKGSEIVLVNEGMSFSFFLKIIFESYPEIEKKYPPGVLGFSVNGKPPKEYDVLENGDKVKFSIFASN